MWTLPDLKPSTPSISLRLLTPLNGQLQPDGMFPCLLSRPGSQIRQARLAGNTTVVGSHAAPGTSRTVSRRMSTEAKERRSPHLSPRRSTGGRRLAKRAIFWLKGYWSRPALAPRHAPVFDLQDVAGERWAKAYKDRLFAKQNSSDRLRRMASPMVNANPELRPARVKITICLNLLHFGL